MTAEAKNNLTRKDNAKNNTGIEHIEDIVYIK